MAKRGRKRDPYITSWGEAIPNLGRLKDGRWVHQDDRSHPWSCEDERDAIREFRRRDAQRNNQTIKTQLVVGDFKDITKLQEALSMMDDFKPILTIDVNGKVGIEFTCPASPFWKALGDAIREHPELAAQYTGIKELAWLQDLQEPPPPLKLSQIRELYEKKKFKDPNESTRSLLYWDEFCEAIKPAETINKITQQQLQAYHDHISTTLADTIKSDKTIRNRYAKIGSILNYAHTHFKAHRTAISSLKTEFNKVCTATNRQKSVPMPIDPDDFAFLYRAADVKWRAILLCMLNFAMHPKEAGQIEKHELNLKRREFQTMRTKTGVLRVGRLWPETVVAIEAYQATQAANTAYQKSPMLFLTEWNKPYSHGGLTRYFRETLKPKAEKLAKCTLSCTLDSIRDGAQNAADDGGADTIHTEMLMGHALPGVMGAYKKRTPKKTDESVRCIYEHYGIADLVSSYGIT